MRAAANTKNPGTSQAKVRHEEVMYYLPLGGEGDGVRATGRKMFVKFHYVPASWRRGQPNNFAFGVFQRVFHHTVGYQEAHSASSRGVRDPTANIMCKCKCRGHIPLKVEGGGRRQSAVIAVREPRWLSVIVAVFDSTAAEAKGTRRAGRGAMRTSVASKTREGERATDSSTACASGRHDGHPGFKAKGRQGNERRRRPQLIHRPPRWVAAQQQPWSIRAKLRDFVSMAHWEAQE
jgi:hypothetical protein